MVDLDDEIMYQDQDQNNFQAMNTIVVTVIKAFPHPRGVCESAPFWNCRISRTLQSHVGSNYRLLLHLSQF
jgi:hypothetical protein